MLFGSAQLKSGYCLFIEINLLVQSASWVTPHGYGTYEKSGPYMWILQSILDLQNLGVLQENAWTYESMESQSKAQGISRVRESLVFAYGQHYIGYVG